MCTNIAYENCPIIGTCFTDKSTKTCKNYTSTHHAELMWGTLLLAGDFAVGKTELSLTQLSALPNKMGEAYVKADTDNNQIVTSAEFNTLFTTIIPTNDGTM